MQNLTSAVGRHLTQEPPTGSTEGEEKFTPRGAMAFFVLMLVVYALLWFSIYFDLIGRS